MKAAIVILDAANPIGRGVAEVALDQRRAVIAVSQDLEALRDLGARFPNADLTIVGGAIADEVQATRLASELRELARPIAGVVLAQCGEPSRNRVLDTPAREFHRLLEADLLPHLSSARQLVPLLAATGRNAGYVVIGSPGSDHPWVGYGSRSIAASASTMLVRVLHEEARSLGVRVQLLAVNRPVCTDANREWSCEGWPEVSAIATQALALIDQVDPHVAALPIVPFVKSVRTATTTRTAARTIAKARSVDASSPAVEPAARALMSTELERLAHRDAARQRVLEHAAARLETPHSSNRNEAEKQ